MYIFPFLVNSNSQQPAHRILEISGDKQPTFINEFADGNKQIIVTNKSNIGKTLKLEFISLTAAQIKTFSDFYNLVGYKSNPWIFPINFYRYTGKWEFSEVPQMPPIINSLSRGLYNLNVTVRKVGF